MTITREAGNIDKLTSPNIRLNGVCPYFTMFKLHLPYRLIADHPEAKIVLDPFCGRGTTLYAARLHGRKSIGIDINPVAAAISRAKISSTTIDEVDIELTKGLSAPSKNIPAGEFWEYCYDPSTLAEICALRYHLLGSQGAAADLLRAVVLGLLHGPRTKLGSYLSNQMPRTYATKPGAAVRYWRREGLKPHYVAVADLVRRRVRYLLETPPANPGGLVLEGSASTQLATLSECADLIVTSPPYLGLRTYAPDQWLRMWFVGGRPDVTYTCPGQLGVQDETKFTAMLADCLTKTDEATSGGATAYFVLGSLPSLPHNPLSLMEAALAASASHWHLASSSSYGSANAGRRQSEQFARGAKAADELVLKLVKDSRCYTSTR